MESTYELLLTLARLFSTIVVIVLFFLYIVRPLLDYLIANREIERSKRLYEEIPDDLAPPVEMGVVRGRGDGAEEADAMTDDHPAPRPGGRLTDQDKLSRLAASDPDKAGELVKQWVNNDSAR